MTESEVVEKYRKLLLPEWKVWLEVWGHNICDRSIRRRIDMVIETREIPKGRKDRIRFGVEFKSHDKLDGTTMYTAWLRQAIGYTQCVWGRNDTRLPILVAPFFNFTVKGSEYILPRIAGKFGIGEMGVFRDCVTIRMSDHRLWDNRTGWNKALVKMDFQKCITL